MVCLELVGRGLGSNLRLFRCWVVLVPLERG